MTQSLQDYVFLVFLVFCRAGSAMMLLPGYSSSRFPASVRLFLAIVISVAITPLVLQRIGNQVSWSVASIPLVAQEIGIGLLMGAAGSLFVHAMRFSGDIISSSIGLGGVPGQPIDSNEPLGQVASFLALSAALLVFASDLHLLAVSAIVQSYESVRPGEPFPAGEINEFFLRHARDASLLTLQIASPFIAYALLSNLILGLVGRIAPRVSLYFIVTGLIIAAGLVLLALSINYAVTTFAKVYESWLFSLFE